VESWCCRTGWKRLESTRAGPGGRGNRAAQARERKLDAGRRTFWTQPPRQLNGCANWQVRLFFPIPPCAKTVIGEDCRIDPTTTLLDTQVGSQTTICDSVAEYARVGSQVSIVRSAICARRGAGGRVHMGNFGEVKSSYWVRTSRWGTSRTSGCQHRRECEHRSGDNHMQF
jgi:hypothetical protein